MIDDNVISEVVFAVAPYVKTEEISDIRMRITMVLSRYDIKKAVTDVVPYQGDVNEQIIKKFLIAKTAAGRSQRTIKEYKSTLTNVMRRIGKPYNQITTSDVRLYLALRINRDGVSKTFADNERRDLSTFYSWLRKERILMENPMDNVEAIKVTKRKKKAFQNIEIEKIRFACRDEMESALVEVLLSTWCRVTEVAEMKISDIEGNRITVHGKGDKYRDVYLTPKAQLAILEYLSKRKDISPQLFPRRISLDDFRKKGVRDKEMHLWWMHPENIDNGQKSTSSIEITIRKIGKLAGVENCHPHRFRRTGATMALRKGMTMIEVSKLLGHENVATTEIYLDIESDQLQETYAKYVM